MKKKTLLLLTFMALILCACEEKEPIQGGHGVNREDGFTLFYQVNGGVSAAARAIISLEPGEADIHSLYLLFFDNSSDQTGEFVTAIDALASRPALTGGSGQLEVNIPENSGISMYKDYKVLLCANILPYLQESVEAVEDLIDLCAGFNEKEVNEKLLLTTANLVPDGNVSLLDRGLPMTAATVKLAGKDELNIEFTRVQSRLDVMNRVSGYELVSASIWNAVTSSRLWEAGDDPVNGSCTQRFYGVSATDNMITSGLYTFENVVDSPMQGDETSTCLILGMKNTSTEEVEFFRTNIHAEMSAQKLIRNNVYRTTIKRVLGTGAITEREAYENGSVLLSTDINGWSVDINGNVVFDKDNILALPTSLINLQGAGEKRTDKIFTYGEGTLRMTREGIPNEVTVELNDEGEFSIHAPASAMEWTGKLHFSIGKLTASITLMQSEHFYHFLDLDYDVEELPEFEYERGAVSPDIEVKSSGAWVAQIYGSNYMSFSSSATQVATITGEADSSFNIRAIAENSTSASRFCFVVVSLQDAPEVSRAIVLHQMPKPEEYLRFNQSGTLIVRPAGETITSIAVESNTEWELSFMAIHQTGMTFTHNGQKVTTLTGEGDMPLVVNIPANNSGNLAQIYILASSKSGKNNIALPLSQKSGSTTTPNPEPEPEPEPTPKESMLFVSNGTGNGNLVSTTSSGYQRFVFVLGSTLRDGSKFGKNGNWVKLKNTIEYTSTFNTANIADAKVIQLLTNPTESYFKKIYNNMQADPNTFLIITSTNYTEVTEILKQFKARTGAAYGAAVQISNYSGNIRPVNSYINQDHPLVKYLFKTGPGGNIPSISNVQLMGNMDTMAGLPASAYPKTFIPILMSRDQNYCVFGIDPVNRLIIMTDPGIFGPAPMYNYASSKNFSYTTHNWTFLNNFACWLVNATGVNGFLKDYQK